MRAAASSLGDPREPSADSVWESPRSRKEEETRIEEEIVGQGIQPGEQNYENNNSTDYKQDERGT